MSSSLPAKTATTRPCIEPGPTQEAPPLSRRAHFRLTARAAELMALLDTLNPLPRDVPLSPALRRRARNALVAADLVIAALPVAPPPPLASQSNTDFAVGILARLSGLSALVRQAGKTATRANLQMPRSAYRSYPRRSAEE